MSMAKCVEDLKDKDKEQVEVLISSLLRHHLGQRLLSTKSPGLEAQDRKNLQLQLQEHNLPAEKIH